MSIRKRCLKYTCKITSISQGPMIEWFRIMSLIRGRLFTWPQISCELSRPFICYIFSDVAVNSIWYNTSYRMISQSIEGAKSVVRIFHLFWDFASFSAVFLSRGLSNCKAIRAFNHPILRLRDFTRSFDKTYYTILNRFPCILADRPEIPIYDSVMFLCQPKHLILGTTCDVDAIFG